MGLNNIFPSGLVRTLLMVLLAATLSACAGRPKPLDPTRPVNVTAVQVTAEHLADSGFAARLEERLLATVGRGTSDVGQATELRIIVLDRRMDAASFGFFGSPVGAASLDILVVDAASGQIVRSRALRASAGGNTGQGAESLLIARLVADIRALLGLSGYPPHPVEGIKRSVAVPLSKPAELTDPELLSADPLLNGEVTPTTADLEPETIQPQVLDISRPLLDATPPAVETPAAASEPAPVAVTVPQGLQLPAVAPKIPAAPAAPAPEAAGGDEPCIITLDNDCSDPDSR